MVKEMVRQIFKNKANNQYSITFPMKIFKKDGKKSIPKKIRIKDYELIF